MPRANLKAFRTPKGYVNFSIWKVQGKFEIWCGDIAAKTVLDAGTQIKQGTHCVPMKIGKFMSGNEGDIRISVGPYKWFVCKNTPNMIVPDTRN